MARYIPEAMTRRSLRACYTRYSLAVLLTLAGVQATATGLVLLVRHFLPIYLADPFWYPVLQVAVNDLSCYIPPAVLFALLLGKLPKAEAPVPVDHLDPWEFLQALVFSLGVGYFLLLLCNVAVMAVEQNLGVESTDIIGNFESKLPLWLTVLSFVVIAPVCEELLFRGLLLRQLRGLGDTSAVVLSGLAFGLFHLNFLQMGYAVLLGMVFGAVVLLTGSIWDTILLHMCINGLSLVMERLPESLQTVWVLGIYLCIFSSGIMLVKTRKNYHFEPGPLPFTQRDKRRACLKNPWFWLMLVVSVAGGIWVAFG